jgi:hypothetical protein
MAAVASIYGESLFKSGLRAAKIQSNITVNDPLSDDL